MVEVEGRIGGGAEVGLDEVGTSSALLVSCSSGFSFYIVSRNLSTPSVTGIYGNTAQFPSDSLSTAPVYAGTDDFRQYKCLFI